MEHSDVVTVVPSGESAIELPPQVADRGRFELPPEERASEPNAPSGSAEPTESPDAGMQSSPKGESTLTADSAPSSQTIELPSQPGATMQEPSPPLAASPGAPTKKTSSPSEAEFSALRLAIDAVPPAGEMLAPEADALVADLGIEAGAVPSPVQEQTPGTWNVRHSDERSLSQDDARLEVSGVQQAGTGPEEGLVQVDRSIARPDSAGDHRAATSPSLEPARQTSPQTPEPTARSAIRELAERVEAHIELRPIAGIALRLETEDMEPLRLVVRTGGSGEVDARIFTASEPAHRALFENRPHLEHSLEAKGMRLASFDVGTETSSGGGRTGAHTHDVLGLRETEQAAPFGARTAHEPNLNRIRQLSRYARGIDIWT